MVDWLKHTESVKRSDLLKSCLSFVRDRLYVRCSKATVCVTFDYPLALRSQLLHDGWQTDQQTGGRLLHMSLMRKRNGEKAAGEITSRRSGKTSLIGFRNGRQNKREVIDVQFLRVTNLRLHYHRTFKKYCTLQNFRFLNSLFWFLVRFGDE